MGGPCCMTWRAGNGRWRRERLSPNKDIVAFWVRHGSIKAAREEGGVGGLGWQTEAQEFTGNSIVRTPIHGCCWGCDSSQWDSVLGQGSASGYGRLFKSFFWLSCPFSTMNARCKAPADALNVITDYSWLTNKQAGSGPINPARFSPMPLQGDSGGASTVREVNGVGH